MRILRHLAGAILFSVFAERGIAGESQVELRGSLLRSHRASVEAIRTVSCTIDIEVSTDGGQSSHYVQGRYMRLGRDFHITEFYPNGRKETMVVRDGSYLAMGQSKEGIAAAKGNQRQFNSICDVWKQMSLSFPGKKVASISLDDFLLAPHSTYQLKRVNGSIVASVTGHDGDFGPRRFEVWFDRDVNYLVRKIITRWGDKDAEGSSVCDILKFAEPEPGLFFPIESRIQAQDPDGKPGGSLVCRISDLQINTPVSRESFELQIPDGTMLADRARNIIYNVDKRGNRAGPARSLPMSNREIPITGAQVHIGGRQTASEPWHFWEWVVVGSAVLLFGSLLVSGINWLKSRRNITV